MRWHLLNALDKARPLGALDTLLLDVMRALYADTTPQELHVQLDYLEERKLVEIKSSLMVIGMQSLIVWALILLSTLLIAKLVLPVRKVLELR